MAKSVRERVEGTTEDMADGMKMGARRTMRAGKKAVREGEHAWNEGVSSINDMAESAGKMARDVYDSGYEEIGHLQDKAAEVVQQRPLTVVLGAFVAGMLLARTFRS